MRLNFDKFGAGSPLLILHGLFGSLDNWRTIANRLSENFEIWTLDLRNHGRSGHEEAMDLRLMAEDVASFCTEHSLDRVILLGHSLGGKVAMQLALDRPEIVSRLVVVDIAPRVYEPRHAAILEALQSFNPASFTDRRVIEDLLAPLIPDLAVRRFLLKNLARDDQGRFGWRLNLPAIARNYPALNSAPVGSGPFHGPTLFVRGGKSDYLFESDLSVIKPLFPMAEMCVVEGADHWVHASAPEDFLKCIKRFLS
jgi:pimeloyl-ACP methyl ester carboxylesterase